MNIHRFARAAASAAIALTLLSGSVVAGQPRVETGFFDGQVVQFLQPAVFSSKPNGGTFACFGLGPDLAKTSRSAPMPPLYVILNDFATQDHCDGDATALDHVEQAVGVLAERLLSHLTYEERELRGPLARHGFF